MNEGKMLVALGAAIRRSREEKGLSQEGFADAIGMHRAYYGLIERGGKNLTLGTLIRVCDGLGALPSQILRDAELKLPKRPKG